MLQMSGSDPYTPNPQWHDLFLHKHTLAKAEEKSLKMIDFSDREK